MTCCGPRRRFHPFRAGLGVGALAAIVYGFAAPDFFRRVPRSRTGAFATALRQPIPERVLLQGIVVDPSGRPLRGASVRVAPLMTETGFDLRDCETHEKSVSARGTFAFTNLKKGFFRIRAIARGYVPQEASRVLLGPRQPAVNLRFVLEPASGTRDPR